MLRMGRGPCWGWPDHGIRLGAATPESGVSEEVEERRGLRETRMSRAAVQIRAQKVSVGWWQWLRRVT